MRKRLLDELTQDSISMGTYDKPAHWFEQEGNGVKRWLSERLCRLCTRHRRLRCWCGQWRGLENRAPFISDPRAMGKAYRELRERTK